MGIQGLLPQLKSIMAAISVEQLRGQTVAVDTYSWLHKGALSCGDRLCKGIPTSRHIEYCMHRVNLLRHHGVRPILVFDGGLLPIKSDQEMKRARSRKENLERAREHEAAGNSRAAFECYQKAVDITPLIAFELIQVLKQEKVDYIVAPYEADAQMTFLSVNKLVDAVITEDSDLIPFGSSRIIFKMDKFGQGVEFQNTKLEKNRELDFNGFTKQMLLEMCILSGCDYLPSLPGMGVKRAHALIQKLKSHEKVIKHLRYSSVSVPPQYEENFKKAIQAFQYQRVYDPATEDIVHLSGIPDGPCGDLDFLGPWLPQAVAKGIAEGNLDPLTKEPFLAKPECRVPVADKVHPIREYVPANGNRRLDLPVQKNVLTNYFCLASLEAKRKFRAPKVTPKQQILRQSSLANSQTEDSTSPGSTEDTSLPVNNKQASQCCPDHFSCEPPQDDSDNVAPECSSEHLSSDFPLDDSANISLQCCSGYVGSAPSEDLGNVNTKVESNYCNGITTPVDSCLEGKLHLISKPFLVSHNMQSSGPALHCIESKMASTNRDVTVRSSYFEAVNRLDYANEGLEILDGKENNCVTGDCVFSGNSARNPRGILKRKLSDIQNVDGETLQPTSLHLSPDDDEEDCDTDPLDAVNTKTEGKFGCNVSHVNKYTGIAEKSMEQFATLISSVRYTGSRASGLRAPLNDVQNTFSARSAARPPRQSKLRCTTKNTAQGPLSWSRFSNKAMDTADSPPDSTFTYKPVAAAASRLDQRKFANKAMDTSDGPDLSTFAYKPIAAAVSCLDQSKFTNKAMDTSDGPPDLSTFAYKPMSAAVSRPDWSSSGTSVKRAGGTPRSNFTCKTRIAAVSPPDQSMFAYTPTKASVSPPDLSTFAYTPTTTNATVKPPDLRTFSFKPMHKSV